MSNRQKLHIKAMKHCECDPSLLSAQRCTRSGWVRCQGTQHALASFEAKGPQAAVTVRPSMKMRMEEIEPWMKRYNLHWALSYKERCYHAELRRPVGDGSSILVTSAQADSGSSALISACNIFEEGHVR